MAYAIDANIGLRMWVRRFLHAACTARGEVLVIPETAREMMEQHYEELNTGRLGETAVQLWRKVPENREQASTSSKAEREIKVLEAHIMMGWNEAFTRWLRTEPERNDSHWRIAPRTRQSVLTAIMLRRAGVWTGDAARDRRYGGTGEDPQVIAEAIVHGAKWIVTVSTYFADFFANYGVNHRISKLWMPTRERSASPCAQRCGFATPANNRGDRANPVGKSHAGRRRMSNGARHCPRGDDD